MAGDEPVGHLLEGYPQPIRLSANRLRSIVKQAVPHAIERVRAGWALIGYDLPLGRKRRYFAFVAPEVEHVHLGFEYGAWMADPHQLLEGAHLQLKKVRFVTFRPGEPIPAPPLIDLVHQAARVAALTPAQRVSLMLDRELDPRIGLTHD